MFYHLYHEKGINIQKLWRSTSMYKMFLGNSIHFLTVFSIILFKAALDLCAFEAPLPKTKQKISVPIHLTKTF